MASHLAFSLGVIALSLGAGIVGYHEIAHFSWIDSLLNASMILGGMGPVGNLESDAAVQLMLTLDRYSGDRLDAALDEARRRFGPAAVTRAVLLGRDSGLVVPLLPD